MTFFRFKKGSKIGRFVLVGFILICIVSIGGHAFFAEMAGISWTRLLPASLSIAYADDGDGGDDSGEDSGDDSGSDSGDDSGDDGGDDSGEDVGDDSGEDVGDDSGEDAPGDGGDFGDDGGDDVREVALPPPPPPVTISGRVFDEDTNVGFANVGIETCRGFQATTNSTGNYSFQVPFREGFCSRAIPLTQPGYDGPFVNNNPGVNESTYEWQVGGWHCAGQGGCNAEQNFRDRGQDDGYDFRYRRKPVPPPPPPPPPQAGCVDVIKETFNPDGRPITPVAQFTFILDGSRTVATNAQGLGRFNDVSPGNHRVIEHTPAGWQLIQITPPGGDLAVSPGTPCAVALFKNRQVLPPALPPSAVTPIVPPSVVTPLPPPTVSLARVFLPASRVSPPPLKTLPVVQPPQGAPLLPTPVILAQAPAAPPTSILPSVPLAELPPTGVGDDPFVLSLWVLVAISSIGTLLLGSYIFNGKENMVGGGVFLLFSRSQRLPQVKRELAPYEIVI